VTRKIWKQGTTGLFDGKGLGQRKTRAENERTSNFQAKSEPVFKGDAESRNRGVFGDALGSGLADLTAQSQQIGHKEWWERKKRGLIGGWGGDNL